MKNKVGQNVYLVKKCAYIDMILVYSIHTKYTKEDRCERLVYKKCRRSKNTVEIGHQKQYNSVKLTIK